MLERHAHVRSLVTNGWISLLQLDAAQGAVYLRGTTGWEAQRPVGT